MKLLIVCETINFQTFTRRATVEAINKLNYDTEAICHTNIKNILKLKLFSQYIKIRCLFYFLPKKISDKNATLQFVEISILKLFYKAYFKKFDFVMFSSPNQYYLLNFLVPSQRVIFLVSDPYHLLGGVKEYEKKVLLRADLILVTANNLKNEYLPKYFNLNNNKIKYWANTVDTGIWNYESFINFKKENKKIVCGFSGNLMEIIDLDLLDFIVDKFTDFDFQIAGKITYSEIPAKLFEIFNKKNVSYLGYIHYNELGKTIINWDICLMLDDKSELSSYIHHNKLYQYLALGKPVVVHRNHHDYDKFSDTVFISDSYEEYYNNILTATKYIDNGDFIRRCINVAKESNSIIRAKEFLEIIEELH